MLADTERSPVKYLKSYIEAAELRLGRELTAAEVSVAWQAWRRATPLSVLIGQLDAANEVR